MQVIIPDELYVDEYVQSLMLFLVHHPDSFHVHYHVLVSFFETHLPINIQNSTLTKLSTKILDLLRLLIVFVSFQFLLYLNQDPGEQHHHY